MIDGINYYQILGLPEDALLKEIQSAWRKFVKENHEDLVAPEERQAAKERMWRINEAYGVLSNEDKRAIYDNSHMLNGGSKIELVRIRVRKAKEILQGKVAIYGNVPPYDILQLKGPPEIEAAVKSVTRPKQAAIVNILSE